jgi:hypothetical protein
VPLVTSHISEPPQAQVGGSRSRPEEPTHPPARQGCLSQGEAPPCHIDWCACVRQARTTTYSNPSVFLNANPSFPIETRTFGPLLYRLSAQKARLRLDR